MDRVFDFIGSFGLAQASETLSNSRSLFLVIAAAVLILYGLSVGRSKALLSLLSIYVAYTLTAIFPFWSLLNAVLPESAEAGAGAILFLLMYAAVFLILSGSMMKSRMSLGDMSIFKVVVISVVQVGLLASITMSLIAPDVAQHLFGAGLPYLAGRGALFTWAAGSILIMPLVRPKRRR